MVQSMTGFGSAEAEGFRVEIRSLNHRFMDVYVKYPPALSRQEMALREILKENFSRGKLDVYVSFSGEAGVRLRPDKAAAGEIIRTLKEIKEEFSLSGEVGLEAVLHWKDLLMQEELEYDAEALYRTFRQAVQELRQMRQREGEALSAEIAARMERIEALNSEIAAICPGVLEAARERFRQRVKELLEGIEYDEARIIQEAGAAAERADVTEEVTRIAGHIGHMRSILSEGETIGRKLDFLIQELNREANTIASKSDDAEVLRRVVEMRAEVERAREQVQNIQ